MVRTAAAALPLNFGLLATLTVVLTLTPYSTDAVLPGFPQAAADLGATASTIQLSLTTFLVGVAAGQLVFGPLSDRLGRRRPLIVGAAICAAAAIVGALAPDVTVLLLARLVQGLAGSAGIVIARAIVRDTTPKEDTARILAMTAVASGVLNVFAPVIGGMLTGLVGWRGPLWFLAAAATAMLVVIVVVVPETHAPQYRDGPSRWLGLGSIVRHLGNGPFLLFVLMQAGSFGTLIAYVASSPFVYQNVLAFDGMTYGVLFAVNAAAAVLANFVANRFLRHIGSRRLVAGGLALSLAGTSLTAAAFAVGAAPAIVAGCITLSMAPLGLNGPNLVGLALNQVTRSTGSASATIGFVQFCTGSIVAPVMGLWGAHTILPMLAGMAVLASLSLAVLLWSARAALPRRAAAAPSG